MYQQKLTVHVNEYEKPRLMMSNNQVIGGILPLGTESPRGMELYIPTRQQLHWLIQNLRMMDSLWFERDGNNPQQ